MDIHIQRTQQANMTLDNWVNHSSDNQSPGQQ